MGQKTLWALCCKVIFFFYTKPLITSKFSFSMTIDMFPVNYGNLHREEAG